MSIVWYPPIKDEYIIYLTWCCAPASFSPELLRSVHHKSSWAAATTHPLLPTNQRSALLMINQSEFSILTYQSWPSSNTLLASILVHEHCHPSHYHQYEQVLQQGISLPPHQHSQHHHWDGFTTLANHLCGVVHPGQRLVAAHHGQQVGEGADGVVGGLGGVLLWCGEHEAHDEGVEIVGNALEEDKRCDGGEPLFFTFINELSSRAEKIGCNIT